MASANPIVLQHKPNSLSPPIILIHDGGGTILNYHALRDLGRNVFGIFNPGPRIKSTWRDGIASLAREYCDMLREVVPAGPVIVGGWSLGGLIALEMALILLHEEKYDVLGVVLVETIYPGLVQKVNGSIEESDLVYGSNVSREAQKRITQSLREAVEAAKLHHVKRNEEYPPTVLIKADEPMPSRSTETVPPMLGWDEDGRDIVKAVYHVPGHHYSIFEKKNVDRLTAELSEACTMLENRVWA